jgi:hypothetical protein
MKFLSQPAPSSHHNNSRRVTLISVIGFSSLKTTTPRVLRWSENTMTSRGAPP